MDYWWLWVAVLLEFGVIKDDNDNGFLVHQPGISTNYGSHSIHICESEEEAKKYINENTVLTGEIHNDEDMNDMSVALKGVLNEGSEKKNNKKNNKKKNKKNNKKNNEEKNEVNMKGLSEKTANFVAQQNNITPQSAHRIFSMSMDMCQNIDESTDINDLVKQVKQMMNTQIKKEQKKKK